MCIRAATGKPKKGALCLLVPVRGPKAGKGRNKIYPTGIPDRSSHFFYFGRAPDDLQAIPQPLYHGPRYEDTAFKGILGLTTNLPGYGSQQVVFGNNGLVPYIH